MVFSSVEFIFLFLPFAVVFYYLILNFQSRKFVAPFLFLVSLFYYGYWKPENVWIILSSIFINYFVGQRIYSVLAYKKLLFLCGLIFNIGLLVFYKYTDFIILNFNDLFSSNIPLQNILLPIGISFFTFQQIAYLSDIYTKKYIPAEKNFASYCCFICFFPQLVAGPIVHYKEMMPQFSEVKGFNPTNFYQGLELFSMGLAKKVLIADNLSPLVGYCFDTAEKLTTLEALFGSLAYTLQLYFDFSAYTDMALGCALFFNIKLPQNFNSPYKALDIQDFWRRWHMTLSRWLRDYLYIPLGGNRGSSFATCRNIFITFVLGGLWHGASWTFVLWGVMHGVALIIHRLWSSLIKFKLPSIVAWTITLFFVNMAWIVFRCTSFERVKLFFASLCGVNGFMFSWEFKVYVLEAAIGMHFPYAFSVLLALVLCCLGLVVFAKNSNEMLDNPNLKPFRHVFCGILLALSLFMVFVPERHTEFIYFQF